MTPDEAIKTMSEWELDNRLLFTENHAKAIKLGIEGLERLKELRTYEPQTLSKTWDLIFGKLPSETEL